MLDQGYELREKAFSNAVNACGICSAAASQEKRILL
jgi:hypothetical protein